MNKKSGVQPQADPPPAWHLGWRVSVSLLLLVHVAAVFTAPFTFATSSGPDSASPFASSAMNALRAYIGAADLNHGYFFFAPNPGPSHLVRCRLENDAGPDADEWLFPDRHRHWPRLLYHRHFMLSESLNSRYVPAEPPPEIVADDGQMAAWREGRRQYELLRESYRQHLYAAHGADRADVIRVEHRQPTPLEFQEGLRLADPSLYRDLPDDALAAPVEVLP
jgi:hypothetical protein